MRLSALLTSLLIKVLYPPLGTRALVREHSLFLYRSVEIVLYNKQFCKPCNFNVQLFNIGKNEISWTFLITLMATSSSSKSEIFSSISARCITDFSLTCLRCDKFKTRREKQTWRCCTGSSVGIYEQHASWAIFLWW